ncbi:MAG: phosphate/phosphite/phosphonate ABC transporter substrate-binding protein [Thermodesulfobacteriota bacterium]
MKLKLQFFSLLLGVCCLFSAAHAEEIRIGVLAKNGPAKALRQWGPTGDYLTRKMVDHEVRIIPLDFDKVNMAIENNDIDFFLVNSSMFVTAKVKYRASAIATMINSRQDLPLESFGGVIITTEYRDDINKIKDLKGKKFGAVKKSSLGGWQMAYKVFKDHGIDPYRDFSVMKFTGKHDNVVFSVINELVDAGTVRTDTLERMAAAGAINMEDFKIINRQNHENFPFVCSTALYPEWPMAKTAITPDALAVELTDALKSIKKSDTAARKAKIIGWTDPLDYGPVEVLQKTLGIGVYR